MRTNNYELQKRIRELEMYVATLSNEIQLLKAQVDQCPLINENITKDRMLFETEDTRSQWANNYMQGWLRNGHLELDIGTNVTNETERREPSTKVTITSELNVSRRCNDEDGGTTWDGSGTLVEGFIRLDACDQWNPVIQFGTSVEGQIANTCFLDCKEAKLYTFNEWQDNHKVWGPGVTK